jgi:hypothetical protein
MHVLQCMGKLIPVDTSLTHAEEGKGCALALFLRTAQGGDDHRDLVSVVADLLEGPASCVGAGHSSRSQLQLGQKLADCEPASELLRDKVVLECPVLVRQLVCAGGVDGSGRLYAQLLVILLAAQHELSPRVVNQHVLQQS